MARRQAIEGLEIVRSVFKRLPEESLKRITNALNKGADDIIHDAIAATPVGVQGPHVKETIRRTEIRLRADGKSAVVYVTAGDTAPTANAAFRSEYGRAPGGSKSQAGHPGHKEQPFMYPAYWANRKRVRGRVAREINRAAKFVAGLRPKA